MTRDDPPPQTQRLRSVRGLVLVGFLAVAAFYLWTEHRAHLYGVLPYLLFLACPLMHLFMHRSHPQAPAPRERPDPADGRRGEETGHA